MPEPLSDAFFEAMRRRLREGVEGGRHRASQGASRALNRRGLFGEGTTGALAQGEIGGQSVQALQSGLTDIQGMEFQKELQQFLIELQRPSFLEQGLPGLLGGFGSLLGGGGLLNLFGGGGQQLLGQSQNPNTQFRRR